MEPSRFLKYSVVFDPGSLAKAINPSSTLHLWNQFVVVRLGKQMTISCTATASLEWLISSSFSMATTIHAKSFFSQSSWQMLTKLILVLVHSLEVVFLG